MILDRETLQQDGCGRCDTLVPPSLIREAAHETAALEQAGIRNPLVAFPSLNRIARSCQIGDLVGALLGPEALLTRAILFDKTPAKNWPVPPHRDTTVAIAERIESPGFGPWSVKDGVVHVRPPDHVLARMWTLRIAIDAAPLSNGPLRVHPGSHLDQQPTRPWRVMTCDPGDVVLMRPLLEHASDRASKPDRRRVLHLEWAPGPLPLPLRWAAV